MWDDFENGKFQKTKTLSIDRQFENQKQKKFRIF